MSQGSMPGASAPKEGKTYKAHPTKRDNATVAATAAATAAASAGLSPSDIGKAAAAAVAAVDAVDAVTAEIAKIDIRKNTHESKPKLRMVDMKMQVFAVGKSVVLGKLPPHAMVVEDEERKLVVFMSGKDHTPEQCEAIMKAHQDRANASPGKPETLEQMLAVCMAIETWTSATKCAEECGVDLLGNKEKIRALTLAHEKLKIPFVNDPTPKVVDEMCADGGGGRKAKAAAGGGGRKSKAAAGGGGAAAAVVAEDDGMDEKPGKRATREAGK